jgi:hypothetical protein
LVHESRTYEALEVFCCCSTIFILLSFVVFCSSTEWKKSNREKNHSKRKIISPNLNRKLFLFQTRSMNKKRSIFFSFSGNIMIFFNEYDFRLSKEYLEWNWTNSKNMQLQQFYFLILAIFFWILWIIICCNYQSNQFNEVFNIQKIQLLTVLYLLKLLLCLAQFNWFYSFVREEFYFSGYDKKWKHTATYHLKHILVFCNDQLMNFHFTSKYQIFAFTKELPIFFLETKGIRCPTIHQTLSSFDQNIPDLHSTLIFHSLFLIIYFQLSFI